MSAVTVDATRRQVDCALSTVSDSMLVVAEELQRCRWTHVESAMFRRRGGAVGMDGALSLVRGPASAFLWC